MDPRIPALRELVGRMEELLAFFGDAGEAESEGLFEAWSRCDEAFECLVEAGENLQKATMSPELTKLLDRAKRLNAVASGMATSELSQVRAEIGRIGDLRRRMSEFATAAEGANEGAGASCDMAG